jgi:hypothetical protein
MDSFVKDVIQQREDDDLAIHQRESRLIDDMEKKRRREVAREFHNWWESIQNIVFRAFIEYHLIPEETRPLGAMEHNICESSSCRKKSISLKCQVKGSSLFQVCDCIMGSGHELLHILLNHGYCPSDQHYSSAYSFFTLRNCSYSQENSMASIDSQEWTLYQFGVTCDDKFLKLTHKFGVLLNQIQVTELRKVLPHLDCASCGNNEELHITTDGNFKLSRLKSHNILSVDPEINNFFLSNQETLSVTNFVDQRVFTDNSDEIDGVCASVFTAAIPNRRKAAKIHDETGVVGLFCARHGTPLLFADLFQGEQYAVIDLLLFKFFERRSRANKNTTKVFLYYDINCNYKPHFKKLLDNVDAFQSLNNIEFHFLVGGMHVKAHGLPCPWTLNPKYYPGAAITDGEACERGWSYIGRYARTTKKMTPANRRNLLERGILTFYIRNLFNQEKNLIKHRKQFTDELSDVQYEPVLNELDHNQVKKKIEDFANREINWDEASEVEKLDYQIRREFNKRRIAIGKLKGYGSYHERSHHYDMSSNAKDSILKLIEDRNALRVSNDSIAELSWALLTNKKSPFWIENTGVSPDDMQKYKVKERISRLKEELKLLDKEIINIESIKDKIKDFFISYRMSGASQDLEMNQDE